MPALLIITWGFNYPNGKCKLPVLLKNVLIFALLTNFIFLSCAKATTLPTVETITPSNVYQDSIKWTDKDLSSIVTLYEAQAYFLAKAEKLYSADYNIQHLSSPFCFALFSKANLFCEKIIFFDKETGLLKNEINVQDLNPYSLMKHEFDRSATIHQLIGENYFVDNGSKKNIPTNLIPPVLYENTPEELPVYTIHINTYIKQDLNLEAVSKEPIVLKFGVDLLPHEEVLEHVAYPGLSTILVLDGQSGQILGKNQDLPFVVQEVVCLDQSKLLLSHLPSIRDTNMYTEYEYWKHEVTIIELDDNESCYHDSSDDEFFIGKDRYSGISMYSEFEGGFGVGDEILSIIIGNEVFEKTISLGSSLKYTASGIYIDDVFLSYEANFLAKTLKCQ